MVQEIVHPGRRQTSGAAIEGPPQHGETSESGESEDEEWLTGPPHSPVFMTTICEWYID